MQLFQPVETKLIHILIAAGLVFWAIASVLPSASTRSENAAGGLSKIRIGSANYRKEGFGVVMIASFAIYNDNAYPVKDVTVTCRHGTPSGTIIDQSTRTIYEKITAGGYTFINDFNMGFVSPQATTSGCQATGFSRA